MQSLMKDKLVTLQKYVLKAFVCLQINIIMIYSFLEEK